MTSRSTSSTSRHVVLVIALLASLVLGAGSASAGPRRRIVVLEFEGPKAEEFHEDLVKLIKKQHTVVPTDRWNGVATDLDAAKVTEKNVKKVAKKLKIDGVVTGKIEKRRDEYIVHLKLRAGASGELVGNPVDTTADGPRLSGQAQRDVKDELIGAIGDLSANHGGGAEDEDADAKPLKPPRGADDADAKPGKKAKTDDDDAKPGKKTSKTDDDDAKPGKKTSKTDDDDSAGTKKGFSKHADRGGDRV